LIPVDYYINRNTVTIFSCLFVLTVYAGSGTSISKHASKANAASKLNPISSSISSKRRTSISAIAIHASARFVTEIPRFMDNATNNAGRKAMFYLF
jgi:hypothetical protein